MTGRELAEALLALPDPDQQVFFPTCGEDGYAVVGGISTPCSVTYEPNRYGGQYQARGPQKFEMAPDVAPVPEQTGYVLLEG